MKLTLTGHGRTLEPKFQDEFVAWSKRVTEISAIDADLIFVGYGVQAPEFQWDDFKGADVKGKILVVLINDPPVPDPADPSKARSQNLRRHGHDLLRPVDLQI